MYESLLPLLACPACKYESLIFKGHSKEGRLVEGTLACSQCTQQYPVEDEIAILVDPAQQGDEWHWEVDIESLETFAAFDTAYANSMPADVRSNRPLLISRMMHVANQSEGPIIDIATGRGVLLRELSLLLTHDHPLIGIDIDLKVLRGLQRFLRRGGLYEQVSLIAMDAKSLALRAGSMGTVTSWFGLNNVPEAQPALHQAERVLASGGKLVTSILNVRPDTPSHLLASDAGFADFLTEDAVRTCFAETTLTLKTLETITESLWPGNPYDALPLMGERFYHRLIIAQKQ